MTTFRVNRHVKRNGDGTWWAPVWPVESSIRDSYLALGINGLSITLALPESVTLTAGSELDIEAARTTEPKGGNARLLGTIKALRLRTVVSVDPSVITEMTAE